MAGRVGFRIASWQRTGEEVLARFGAVGSAQVADTMSKLGGMDARIRPVWRSPKVIGSALTVWCHSGDNLMLHKALSLAQPGDIVVVNTQGNRINSPFGDLLGTTAVKSGVRAIIVDGTVRDGDRLESMRLPVYAHGLSPSGCNRDGGGEIGTAIACGGVAVRAGDVVLADSDGVVVVPRDDAEAVARLAIEKVAQEEQRLSEIHQGVWTRPQIDELLRQLKVIE